MSDLDTQRCGRDRESIPQRESRGNGRKRGGPMDLATFQGLTLPLMAHLKILRRHHLKEGRMNSGQA